MIAAIVRDTLGRVPEASRVAGLDARVQAFRRVVDRLAHEVQVGRVGGVPPRVTGVELLVIEGSEIASEARQTPGYDEVAAMVAGYTLGLATAHGTGEADHG